MGGKKRRKQRVRRRWTLPPCSPSHMEQVGTLLTVRAAAPKGLIPCGSAQPSALLTSEPTTVHWLQLHWSPSYPVPFLLYNRCSCSEYPIPVWRPLALTCSAVPSWRQSPGSQALFRQREPFRHPRRGSPGSCSR